MMTTLPQFNGLRATKISALGGIKESKKRKTRVTRIENEGTSRRES
jgi:hypothetical protein